MSESNEPGWIWKIFGGTILAMVTLLLITLFNTINVSINNAKQEAVSALTELKGEIRDNRQALDSLKERTSSLENNEAKTKIEALSVELKRIELETINRQERIISNETSVNSLKEDVKSLKDEVKEINKQIHKVKATIEG